MLTADRVAVAGLCALVTLFFAPALFSHGIFFYRDLSVYFYPEQQFVDEWIRRGVLPLWNPFSFYGQAFQADPINQLFYPATLLRLLLPLTFAFKLEVILHFYLAAVSCYCLARRLGQSAAAAFFAAAVFVFCGPFVSLGNFLNFLATAAWMPVALLLTHRAVTRAMQPVSADSFPAAASPSKRHWDQIAGSGFLWLGAVFAVQFSAGEPVTLLLTIITCAGFAIAIASDEKWKWRSLARVTAGFAVCGMFSVMLAAVQVLPFLGVLSRTYRGQSGLSYEVATLWSLHPFSFAEFFIANFFGDVFSHSASAIPWLRALNSNREPFILSLYFGFIPIVLALFGTLRGKRTARFFAVTGCIAFFFALGKYNPLHHWFYDHIAVLRSIRYPVKLVIVTALGVAMLSGFGFDFVRAKFADARKAKIVLSAIVAAALLIVASLTLVIGFPAAALNHLSALASQLGITDARQAAGELASALPGRLIAAAGLLLPLALVLLIRRQTIEHNARLVTAVLVVLAGAPIASLMMVHRTTNPVGPLEIFERSPTIERAIDATSRDARLYVDMGVLDNQSETIREKLAWMPVKDGWSQEAMLAAFLQDLLQFSAHRKIYTGVATDWTGLLPFESYELRRYLSKLGPEERDRLLGLTGVRYEIKLSPSPNRNLRLVAELPTEARSPLYLYENPDWRPRAYVAENIVNVQNSRDMLPAWLVAAQSSSKVAVLERSSPRNAESAATGSATIIDDSLNELAVRAELDRNGYLVVSDSYDPHWKVEVDGQAGQIERANLLFRAVRLSKGAHSVKFSYRPASFLTGAAITALTLCVALVGLCIGFVRRFA